MEKIGILGGTFNPVHIEHISLAKSAISELGLDRLFVMPTYLSPHKKQASVSAQDRLNMLKIAFSDCANITVCDYEIEKGGKSYTYLTAEYFRKLYNDAQIYFICGGDMLTNFKSWRFPERVLSAVQLAVFDREGVYTDYENEKEYFKKTFNKEFVKLNYVGKPVSSTKARVYASFGLSLHGLVEKGVEDYIVQNGLYAGDKYTLVIKKNLPEKRIKHTADVVVSALSKAKELGLDEDKVRISATLHDMAKYVDYTTVKGFTLPEDVPSPVVHAFLGAYMAENLLGIKDEEILDAIRYHTSGKAQMSTLGKLIFVADMVEEGRVYDGVDKLRQSFENDDFEECFVKCLKEEFIHLINKKQYIYKETLNAFAYYTK